MDYITNIDDVDTADVLRLAKCSLRAYDVLGTSCGPDNCSQFAHPPDGYRTLTCWTGVDSFFGCDPTVERYGVVFQSIDQPSRYIFAFRGTDSAADIIQDLGVDHTHFVPFSGTTRTVPHDVKVEAGFFEAYSQSTDDCASMQAQLLKLLESYLAADEPMTELFITGHSLGAGICELFTLDVALRFPSLAITTINFACPRVGNQHFVDFYGSSLAAPGAARHSLRVQNTYDFVPCVPLESMDYSHTPRALLIAFYPSGLEYENPDYRHSMVNYLTVLECASGERSQRGQCICNNLPGVDGHKLESVEPDPHTVCKFSPALDV